MFGKSSSLIMHNNMKTNYNNYLIFNIIIIIIY